MMKIKFKNVQQQDFKKRTTKKIDYIKENSFIITNK